jgi:hypothetical protein
MQVIYAAAVHVAFYAWFLGLCRLSTMAALQVSSPRCPRRLWLLLDSDFGRIDSYSQLLESRSVSKAMVGAARCSALVPYLLRPRSSRQLVSSWLPSRKSPLITIDADDTFH